MSRRFRKGGSAIETALLAPVAVTMMAGFLEYGWYFVQDLNLKASVREASRIAVGTPVEYDPAAAFKAQLGVELADRKMDHMTWASTQWVSGDAGSRMLNTQVSVQYPGLTGLIPVPSAIKQVTTTRLEDQEP